MLILETKEERLTEKKLEGYSFKKILVLLLLNSFYPYFYSPKCTKMLCM